MKFLHIDHSNNEFSLIVVDYMFYTENQHHIEKWLNECPSGWTIEGSILFFKTDYDRLLFLLRWA